MFLQFLKQNLFCCLLCTHFTHLTFYLFSVQQSPPSSHQHLSFLPCTQPFEQSLCSLSPSFEWWNLAPNAARGWRAWMREWGAKNKREDEWRNEPKIERGEEVLKSGGGDGVMGWNACTLHSTQEEGESEQSDCSKGWVHGKNERCWWDDGGLCCTEKKVKSQMSEMSARKTTEEVLFKKIVKTLIENLLKLVN